jgi:hypothetical protein
MAEWRNLHEAPRDAPVKLFLPCVKFDPDERGRPKPDSVQHGECIGIWDTTQSHWVNRDSGAKVYPSGWQPLDGA